MVTRSDFGKRRQKRPNISRTQACFKELIMIKFVSKVRSGAVWYLVILSCLIPCSTSQAQNNATPPPPPGRLVDIGSRQLHLYCIGNGAPTVIMENGQSSFSVDWGLVQPEIAKVTRVCTYDRAG